MATMTDCDVCSTPRDKDVVTEEFLVGRPFVEGVELGGEGGAIPDASWYSSDVSEAFETLVSLKETSSTP